MSGVGHFYFIVHVLYLLSQFPPLYFSVVHCGYFQCTNSSGTSNVIFSSLILSSHTSNLLLLYLLLLKGRLVSVKYHICTGKVYKIQSYNYIKYFQVNVCVTITQVQKEKAPSLPRSTAAPSHAPTFPSAQWPPSGLRETRPCVSKHRHGTCLPPPPLCSWDAWASLPVTAVHPRSWLPCLRLGFLCLGCSRCLSFPCHYTISFT